MSRINFEKLRVYKLSAQLADETADVKKIKPLVDNLAPQLTSYSKSIGRAHQGEQLPTFHRWLLTTNY